MARAKLSIRFRKDRGLWEVDYRDAGGVRRRPVFATEEDAHAFATKIFRVPAARSSADRQVTLREYAARWLEEAALDKEPTTVRCYRERLDGHVLPALGRVRLCELHRGQIKALLADKRRQGHAKNGVRLMKAALSAMLSDAVDEGLLDVNPALQLGRRKASRVDKLSAAERVQALRPMTWEQRDAFLAAAAGERRYATLFALLVKGGLRPGEAFALTPGDVDLGQSQVRVRAGVGAGTAEVDEDRGSADGRRVARAGARDPRASGVAQERRPAPWSGRA